MSRLRSIFFLSLLLRASFAFSYVVEGVRTSVVINGIKSKEIESIRIEGCDKVNCRGPSVESVCLSRPNTKWDCYLKGEFPAYVWFTVDLKNKKSLKTKFMLTNGASVLDNFRLVFIQNSVRAEPLKLPI